jgi:hypothetical protein
LQNSTTLNVQGSLHVLSERRQNEDETAGYNRVILTSANPVVDFNNASPSTMYLATLSDGTQYSFSSRGAYYQNADMYHYVGTAVLPAVSNQLITSPNQLLPDAIVSNSLPFWLSLNTYAPPYPGFTTNGLYLYPSFIVPDNIVPPYGVVHIDPNNTETYQSAPVYDASLTPSSLTKDVVKVTLYGLNNSLSHNFLDCVLQYSFDTNNIGMGNMPVIRDEKRTQTEMAIIAQKKTIIFEVWYQQTTIRDLARQMILSCINNVLPQSLAAQS